MALATCANAQSAAFQPGPVSASRVESTNQSSRQLAAEPKAYGASPFLPTISREVRLPVTINGFCVVTLRERQEWLVGSEAHQLVFDGRLYWFAGQRERAIFAATLQRYVPALSGDCVVTFAESGVRQSGDPQHGILHDHRLFFFRGFEELKRFQSDPNRYAKIDLANGGRCLVSFLDDERQLLGLPETTVIHNGLRYQFAGVHQQSRFLANMRRYGVARLPSRQFVETSHDRLGSPPPLAIPQASSLLAAEKSEKPPLKSSAAEVTNKAMGGYCPVSIRELGTWVTGNARFRVEFDGQTYLMAGEGQRKKFAENPGFYLPALGGHCVVNEIDSNRRVPGSIYYPAWHEGENRLFLFAGAEEKEAFIANPESYLAADLASDGNCIVTLVDDGQSVAGQKDLTAWHHNKRYLFASPEKMAKFRENIQRYQDR